LFELTVANAKLILLQAISGGLSAAATICAVIKGDFTEAEAVKWHSKKVEAAYTRFLLVVLTTYQQIRVQNVPILSSNDNFDQAFDFYRPIIQGNSDSGKKLAGDDLQKTIEFLAQHAFEPAPPEERAKLVAQYGDKFDKLPTAPSDNSVESVESRNILKSIAVMKLMRTEDVMHINNESLDIIEGYRMRLQRGSLGMDKA